GRNPGPPRTDAIRSVRPVPGSQTPATVGRGTRRVPATLSRSAPMPDVQQFDLIVIGAGPAGCAAANTAAMLGKKVAIVEKNPAVGGAAINTGTIPSKPLRETALALSGIRSRALIGVDISLRREANVDDFLRHERQVRTVEAAQSRKLLDRFGVNLIPGV